MFGDCSSLKNVTINLPNALQESLFNEYCTALERVNITTNQGNESAFTKESLGIPSSSTHLYVNGVEVTD